MRVRLWSSAGFVVSSSLYHAQCEPLVRDQHRALSTSTSHLNTNARATSPYSCLGLMSDVNVSFTVSPKISLFSCLHTPFALFD